MRTPVATVLLVLVACGGSTTTPPDYHDVIIGFDPGKKDTAKDAPKDAAKDAAPDLAKDADGDATWQDPGGDGALDPGDPDACVPPECVPLVCAPGQKSCSDDNEVRTCNATGTGWTFEDCGDLLCVDAACVTCAPGSAGCQGDVAVRCDATGNAWVPVQDCKPAETALYCVKGQCLSLCEGLSIRTNEGCEYWPLDLDQNEEFDAPNMQFAVIVSNTSTVHDAKVTITKGLDLEKEVIVPKGDLATILLDPLNIEQPGVDQLSRRLKSTVPIVAYQFNPLENVGVFSNDASLLLPTNVLGKTYRVMAWRQRADALKSYFTLVAVEEGTTDVTLTVTVPTVEGPGLAALPAGGTATLTLQQFQTLHVKSDQSCGDLTGSLIQATKKVAVMGGHECANIPTGGSCSSEFCCCDHLEDQMLPVEAWGKSYLVGRTWPRGQAPETVRVLAAMDGTSVTVDGAAVGVPVLGAGQFHEFQVTSNVAIAADKPVMVAQYMESQTSPTGCSETCDDAFIFGKKCDGSPFGKSCDTDEDCCPGVAGIGDPALIVAVPTEQFRSDYLFLVPTKYASNYVNVVAPTGATVTLDGETLGPGEFEPIGSSPFGVARRQLADGVHRLSAPQKAGILVYGWDQYVSYGFAGGMAVQALNP